MLMLTVVLNFVLSFLNKVYQKALLLNFCDKNILAVAKLFLKTGKYFFLNVNFGTFFNNKQNAL